MMHRRTACFIAALLVTGTAAGAADTVRIVTPFAAGGPADMLARLIAQELTPRLAAEAVVENRGGAGGIIGTELVARAAPDGKTLLVGSLGSHVISPTLHGALAYDPVAAFTPLALIGSVPSVLVISPKERSPMLPDVPTTAELGFPGAVMENWYGVFAPAGLTGDVATRLDSALKDALRSPAMQKRLADAGLRGTLDGAAFRAKLAADFAYWRSEIKTLGITGE
jgi:tripartite-type tricarboxylate transporter receptor subunit TctC